MKQLVLGVLCLGLLSTIAHSQERGQEDPIKKEQSRMAGEAQHLLNEKKDYHEQAVRFAQYARDTKDSYKSYCWSLYSQMQERFSQMYSDQVDVFIKAMEEIDTLNAKLPSN